MQRLITAKKQVISKLMNKQFTNYKQIVLANCFKTILAFKLLAEDDEDFTEQAYRVLKGLHNIAEYQLAGGNGEIKISKEYIYYDDIKSFFPKTFITCKRYRCIYIEKNKIQINKIEQSLKENISKDN